MTAASALLATAFSIAFAAGITLWLPPGAALAVVFTLVAGACLAGGAGLAWAIAICLVVGMALTRLRRRYGAHGKHPGEMP